MTVGLIFSRDELTVPPDVSETVAVEMHLARVNLHDRKTLLGWDRTGERTYEFMFCRPNGIQETRMTDDGISLAPWQIFLFSEKDGDLSCLRRAGHFRTVHLASEFVGMHVGDPVEIIRMSDMQVLGHATVTAVKQTQAAHLNIIDVKEFLPMIGITGTTIPQHPGQAMTHVLSEYYGSPVTMGTEVTVIEMWPSNDSYRLNRTGPLQAIIDRLKPAIGVLALLTASGLVNMLGTMD